MSIKVPCLFDWTRNQLTCVLHFELYHKHVLYWNIFKTLFIKKTVHLQYCSTWSIYLENHCAVYSRCIKLWVGYYVYCVFKVFILLIWSGKYCEALQSWLFHHTFVHVCYIQLINYRYQKIQIHYSQIVANQMMMKMLIKSLLWDRLIISLWLVWSRSTPQFIKTKVCCIFVLWTCSQRRCFWHAYQ